MSTCIYCMQSKTHQEFSSEHVLSRAFCGQGNNWTLVNMVCRECNKQLSAFESHWAQSAVESMMRNFSGPIGRGKKAKKKRVQPTEVDDVYLAQRDDTLVYEAGFAFPNTFYLRPQIIQTSRGIVAPAADEEDGQALRAAVETLAALQHVELSKPIDVTRVWVWYGKSKLLI